MGKLFSCPTCRNRISVNAESCPQCGERQFREFGFIDSWGRVTQNKEDAQVHTEHRKCPSCNGRGTKTEERPYSFFFGIFSGVENVEVPCRYCKGGSNEIKTIKTYTIDKRTGETSRSEIYLD